MKVQVFVVSYETNKATWRVYLLAESKEDAMGYLMREVGNEAEGFRINNFETREEIHAITSKVLDGIRGPEQEVKVIENDKLICPWCESTDYKTNHALKMHIVKSHTGKMQKPKYQKTKTQESNDQESNDQESKDQESNDQESKD